MEGENRSANRDRRNGKQSKKLQRNIPKIEPDYEYQLIGVDMDDKAQCLQKKPSQSGRKDQLKKISSNSDCRKSVTEYENSGSSTSVSEYNYDTDTSYKKIPAEKRKSKKTTKRNDVEMLTSPINDNSALPRKRLVKLENTSKQGYLGVLTRHDAELLLGSKHKFALYHDLGYSPILCNMNKEIQLAGVYRSSKGTFSHFQIREQNHNDLTKEYYVDTGKSVIPRTFLTIEKLMESYCRK